MKHDPTIAEAQRLWKANKAKEALTLLAKRVQELSGDQSESKTTPRRLLGRVVLVVVLVTLIASAVLIIPNLEWKSRSDQDRREINPQTTLPEHYTGSRLMFNYPTGWLVEPLESGVIQLSNQQLDNEDNTLFDVAPGLVIVHLSNTLEFPEAKLVIKESSPEFLPGYFAGQTVAVIRIMTTFTDELGPIRVGPLEHVTINKHDATIQTIEVKAGGEFGISFVAICRTGPLCLYASAPADELPEWTDTLAAIAASMDTRSAP